MPLKLKKKQITVEVSELTIELDEVLTKFLTDAAKSQNVEQTLMCLDSFKRISLVKAC